MTNQPLPYSHTCFVCGEDNPKGLRLRFERVGDWVQADCRLERHYNGFLHRSHGGIAAALVDEAMGWATVLAGGRFTYTVELKMRYRLPVPLETPLLVRARVTRNHRRLASAEGELLGPEGELLVAGEGKFMFTSADETARIAAGLIYRPGAWRPPGAEGEGG